MNSQGKYGKNRNLWRKLYPIGAPRRSPNEIIFVDPNTSITHSYDLQKVIRHRDYFKVIQYGAPADEIVFGEYDEGLIHFNNEESVSFNFNFIFSNVPYVVFSMEQSSPSGSNLENVNIFGLYKSVSGGIVGLSAPFSGTVRYRAAWSSTFPANFTSPYTASIFASAGTIGVNHNVFYTASYATLANIPSEFRNSPFNLSSSGQPDVYLTPDIASYTNSSVNVDISAPYSGNVDFIAYQ